MYMSLKTAKFRPAPSQAMKHRTGVAWAQAMRESGALCSAILRVAHPHLYDAGREALIRASKVPAVDRALQTWPSIFHVVQVISNRQTPFHRDTSGQATWMELLISFGSYRRAFLVLRNLGFQVEYGPGTAGVVCSYLVHHGVAEVEPDRICYAWFMSDALHTNHGVNAVPWMTRAYYDCI